MLGYGDVQSFVSTGLMGLGYGLGSPSPAMPLFNPGPPTAQRLQTLTPDAMVFLTVGNGLGMAKEGLYDQPFIVVRVLGPQSDYDSTEALAHDIDRLLLVVGEQAAGVMGSTRVLFVTRNAPPQLVDFDASDRYHFQTTYLTEATR